MKEEHRCYINTNEVGFNSARKEMDYFCPECGKRVLSVSLTFRNGDEAK